MSAPILIADPYVDFRELIAFDLQQRGYVVKEAHDGDAVLTLVARKPPCLLVLSAEIGPEGGVALATKLREGRVRHFPIVMLTNGSSEKQIRASDLHLTAVLKKPFALDDLAKLVHLLAPSFPAN